MSKQRHDGPAADRLVVLALMLGLPFAALAQYKIVGPDGKVTYSDRPPVSAPGKVREIDVGAAAAAAAQPALPLELRPVVARYPVTFYSAAACEPCDAGRQLLRERGIPHVEKRAGPNDGEALQAAIGTKQIPALTIGSQLLRGFSAAEWSSYLDAAGYPKQSRLPAQLAAPQPQPLVPAADKPASTAAQAAPAPREAPVAPPPAPGGIRF